MCLRPHCPASHTPSGPHALTPASKLLLCSSNSSSSSSSSYFPTHTHDDPIPPDTPAVTAAAAAVPPDPADLDWQGAIKDLSTLPLWLQPKRRPRKPPPHLIRPGTVQAVPAEVQGGSAGAGTASESGARAATSAPGTQRTWTQQTAPLAARTTPHKGAALTGAAEGVAAVAAMVVGRDCCGAL